MDSLNNPLVAMLFVEDLIAYVLKKNGTDWPEERGVRAVRDYVPKKRFFPEIGEAVHLMVTRGFPNAIAKCYDELISKGITSVDDYRYEAAITTIHWMNDGYDTTKYLKLCALLTGITLMYYKKNDTMANDIASASAQILAYIVNFYVCKQVFLPRSDWFSLVLTSQTLRRKLMSPVEYDM